MRSHRPNFWLVVLSVLVIGSVGPGQSPVANPLLPIELGVRPTGAPVPVTPEMPLQTVPGGVPCDDPLLGSPPERKRFEAFPTSLLWEPQLADKSQPRLSAVFHNTDSVFSRQTLDPSIGLTAGVFRIRPEQFPNIEWQVDVFAVSHLRFSRLDESIAQNYRAGVPVSFRTGNWVGKIGYEHTSTQLGDELLVSGLRDRITYERDEVVGALGYIWENQLRVYGQTAWAFYRSIPGDPDRWRFDAGFDWFKRVTTGKRGQPFAAINAAFDPAVNYEVTMNYQLGWMWRVNDRRLSQFRVYAEFYDGRSMYGQFFQTRERYGGVGISLDY